MYILSISTDHISFDDSPYETWKSALEGLQDIIFYLYQYDMPKENGVYTMRPNAQLHLFLDEKGSSNITLESETIKHKILIRYKE